MWSILRPPQAGLREHTYRFLQGPRRLQRRSGVFSVRVMKYWNRLLAHLVLSPSVSIFKNSWTVNGPKFFLPRLCTSCPHSLTFFSILLPQTIYIFPYPQSSTSLCDYYWPSWSFLPLINKIKCVLGHQVGTQRPKTLYKFRKYWLKVNPLYPNCVCK